MNVNDIKNTKIRTESIPISTVIVDDKNAIKISKSREIGYPYYNECDVREFKMYPINGVYDGILKATPKGFHFDAKLLPKVIEGMLEMYKDIYGVDYQYNTKEEK
jgi:hypothetical protein